jgi:single-strand DNA-binding protein
MGRVGKDPEIRDAGNSKVANFSIATDEGYFNKENQWVEAVEWHRITVWNKQAEKVHAKIKKGDIVLIQGKLKTDSWDDPDRAGKKLYSTSIVAFIVKHISDQGRRVAAKQNGGMAPQAQPAQTYTAPGGTPQPLDDLPF